MIPFFNINTFYWLHANLIHSFIRTLAKAITRKITHSLFTKSITHWPTHISKSLMNLSILLVTSITHQFMASYHPTLYIFFRNAFPPWMTKNANKLKISLMAKYFEPFSPFRVP